jgi:hypothetical protein
LRISSGEFIRSSGRTARYPIRSSTSTIRACGGLHDIPAADGHVGIRYEHPSPVATFRHQPAKLTAQVWRIHVTALHALITMDR